MKRFLWSMIALFVVAILLVGWAKYDKAKRAELRSIGAVGHQMASKLAGPCKSEPHVWLVAEIIPFVCNVPEYPDGTMIYRLLDSKGVTATLPITPTNSYHVFPEHISVGDTVEITRTHTLGEIFSPIACDYLLIKETTSTANKASPPPS